MFVLNLFGCGGSFSGDFNEHFDIFKAFCLHMWRIVWNVFGKIWMVMFLGMHNLGCRIGVSGVFDTMWTYGWFFCFVADLYLHAMLYAIYMPHYGLFELKALIQCGHMFSHCLSKIRCHHHVV